MQVAYYINNIEMKLLRLKPRMNIEKLRNEYDSFFQEKDDKKLQKLLMRFNDKLNDEIDRTEPGSEYEK